MEESKDLVQAVEQGVMNAQNIEAAQRYLQINLASKLISGINALDSNISKMKEMQEKVINRLKDKMDEIDIVDDVDLLLTWTSKLNGMIINSVEVQRKVAQGKELLSSYPTLSDEEKEVVKMMKALDTDDKKRLFLKTLKDVLTRSQEQAADFEE